MTPCRDARPRCAASANSTDGQRGELGGLEHDRVAGGDGGKDLPRRHLQRVVPRRDRSDDPDRFAPDARRVVGRVLGRRLALEIAGGAAEEGDVVDRARHVEPADQLDRLARVAALDGRDLVGPPGQNFSPAGQQRRALGRSGARPRAKGRFRCRDGLVDVLFRRAVTGRDDLTGRRLDDGDDVFGCAVAPLAGNELEHFVGHVPPGLVVLGNGRQVTDLRVRVPTSRRRCSRGGRGHPRRGRTC